jgi:hypothetical protein
LNTGSKDQIVIPVTSENSKPQEAYK